MTNVKPMSQAEIGKFKDWLVSKGAEVLEPTNHYEAVRFKAKGVVQIVYSNQRGDAWATMNGANDAVNAFRANSNWTAKGTRRCRKNLGHKVLRLLDRDGDRCFYCDRRMNEDQITIEHLVPHSHGGPNDEHNLALAHRKCNERAGNLHLVAKVRLRDRLKFARTESEVASTFASEAAVEMFGADVTEQHEHLGLENVGNK